MAHARRLVPTRRRRADASAWNSLGLTLAAQGRLDDAVFAYIRALTADPLFARARDNLGVALVAQGRIDEAITAHASATVDDPAFGEGHLHHAAALTAAGRLLDAIVAYRRAMEVDPEIARSASVRNRLGLVFAHAGDMTQAMRQFLRAIALQDHAIHREPPAPSVATSSFER